MANDGFEKKADSIKKSIQNRVDRISERINRRVSSINQRFSPDSSRDSGSTETGQMQLDSNRQMNSYSFAKINAYDALRVEVVDESFNEIFSIGKYFKEDNLRYPTFYCETLEEFFEPHVKYLAISDAIKEYLISTMVAEAEQRAASRGGGVFGVNWPGEGCYLNGWLLSYPNTEDPASALKDQTKIPYILETLAHEKLGHGFLSEFTTLGNEMQKIQMARFKVAEDFNIKISDSPKEILLKEKWQYLFTHCMYAEEGYATWIEELLLQEMSGSSSPKYSEEKVLATLERVDLGLATDLKGRTGSSLSGALKICLNPTLDDVGIHKEVRLLEEFEWHISSSKQWDLPQPARYVIGFLLLDRIARVFGRELVPYIMAIAYNVCYDLDNISNSDLTRILDNEPSMNIHTRLLTILAAGSDEINSVESLVQMCKTSLNMAIPANFNI